MPALMPCSLTVEGVQSRAKTVTRRDPATWARLKPGDRLTLVKQRQGIPKGGHVERLAEVVVTSVRVETLGDLSVDDVQREAVNEHLDPLQWAEWWAHAHGWRPAYFLHDGAWRSRDSTAGSVLVIPCRRIEWAYLDDDELDDGDGCAYFDPWPCEVCDSGARPCVRGFGGS